jgi:hypothetical protein
MRDVLEALPDFATSPHLPVNVLVWHGLHGSDDGRLRRHQVSRALPNGSFARIGNRLFVSSPELCFVQLAKVLPLEQLIEAGFELCGGFVSRTTGPELPRRKPLTSVGDIESALAEWAGSPGAKNGRRAIAHVIEGSASPKETQLTMLLSMPRRLGGFGLPRPVLNAPIELSGAAAKIMGRGSVRGDLLWEEKRLVVEYDSASWHASAPAIAMDANRRNALKDMGYDVITVTGAQIMSHGMMEQVAAVLERRLGVRRRAQSAGLDERRLRLRRLLFDPGCRGFLV